MHFTQKKNDYAIIAAILIALISISAYAQTKPAGTKKKAFKNLRELSKLDLYTAEASYANEVKDLIQSRSILKEDKFFSALGFSYYNLGRVYLAMGNYKKADLFYNKIDSLSAYYAQHGTDKMKALFLFNYLQLEAGEDRAQLMIETGDLDEAKMLIDNNLRIRKSNLDKFNSGNFRSYKTLGNYYFAAKQYDSSIYNYTKYILAIRNNWFSFLDINILGNAYVQLAQVYLINGNSEKAIEYAQKGFKISVHPWAKKNNRENPLDQALASNTVAESYRQAGSGRKAKTWSDKSISLLAKSPLKPEQDQLPVYTTRALLFWSDNNIDSARYYFAKVVNTYFHYVNQNFAYLSEYERIYFYNNSKYPIEYAKAFYLQRLQKNNDSSARKDLYELSLNTKGILFNSSLKFINKIYTSGDTSIISQYDDLKRKKNTIANLSLENKPENAQKIQLLNQQIQTGEKNIMDKLQVETETFITQEEILKAIPADHQLVEVMKCYRVSLPSIGANSLLKSISLSDSSTYVYFISNPANTSFTTTFSDRNALLDTRMYSAYRNAVKFNLKNSDVYDSYFKSIDSQLVSKNIFYAADGIYNLINPNVLYDGKVYLTDRFNVTSIISSKELLSHHATALNVSSISFFGRPDFSGHAQTGSKSSYADLPGTEKEIAAIEKIVPGRISTQSFIGARADEGVVKESASATIIHFATHGYFNDDNSRNPLLNSGIVLAIPKSLDEDGLLTAYEASTLNLSNTSLVVLSACETGLGKSIDGDGVWGLQRSFQLAGVNYIIMSLFKVDDEITASLMIDFYSNLLSGKSVSDSFKKAETNIKLTHPEPEYWGAFILKGY